MKRKNSALTALVMTLTMMIAGNAFAGEEIPAAEQQNEAEVNADSNQNVSSVPEGIYTAIDELSDKRIGVQTGTSFDKMIEEKLPDAEIQYFNSKADEVAALKGDKIDAFVVDEAVSRILMKEDEQLACLPEYLDTFDAALVFAKNDKGEALRDQFNSFLDQLPEGTLESLSD